MCVSVIVPVKKDGLNLEAEIKNAKDLEVLMNRPPKKNSIIRVASVIGTRPGLCTLYWRDETNKVVEVAGVVL